MGVRGVSRWVCWGAVSPACHLAFLTLFRFHSAANCPSKLASLRVIISQSKVPEEIGGAVLHSKLVL